jgi:hypothetical protein
VVYGSRPTPNRFVAGSVDQVTAVHVVDGRACVYTQDRSASWDTEYSGFFTTSMDAVAKSEALLEMATVEALAGAGLKYRVRPNPGCLRGDVLDLARRIAGCTGRDDSRFDVPKFEDAFFFDTQLRLFRGFPYGDLRLGVVSLVVGRSRSATTRTDASDADNVLVAAGVRTPLGTWVYTGSPYEIQVALSKRINEADLDVIVGFGLASFGLNFLSHIYQRENPEDELEEFSFRNYRTRLEGRHLLDLERLCGAFDGGDRSPVITLSQLAAHCCVPGFIETSPRALFEMAADAGRCREAAAAHLALSCKLTDLYLEGAYALACELPIGLDDAAHLKGASLVDVLVREHYHVANLALPLHAPGQRRGGGGLIDYRTAGRAERVAYFDLVANYPTIMAATNDAPASDVGGAIPSIAKRLVALRDTALQLRASAVASGDLDAAARQKLTAGRYKNLLANTYGVTGSEWCRVCDHRYRAGIADRGRLAASAMVDSVTALGGIVRTVETDGLFLSWPEHVGLEALRSAAEAAANQALGISHLRLRIDGEWDAMLFGGALHYAENLQKGMAKAPSPFTTAIRDRVLATLLCDDRGAAAGVIRDALQAIETRAVSASELRVELVVDGAPLWMPAGRERDALWTAHAVDGDVVGIVEVRASGGGPNELVVVNESGAVIDYDIAWATAQLRKALSPLAHFLPLDAIWQGLPVSGPVTCRVSSAAKGTPRMNLVAGVKKTQKRREIQETADYGDRAAEESLLARNSDAHSSLLGYFGKAARDHELPFRVRTGDYYIELEDELGGNAPLAAARAIVLELEKLGADGERDIRVMFNGNRSFLVKVRQSAFGVENCIELPELYHLFTNDLWARVAEGFDSVLYDRMLYNAARTYRVTGAVHQETGFEATWMLPHELWAYDSIEDMRTMPESVAMAPFVCSQIVPQLKDAFDMATRDVARSVTFDGTVRRRSRSSASREKRENNKLKLQLPVLRAQNVIPPCAALVLENGHVGSGIAAVAKTVFELRRLGRSSEEIAHRLMTAPESAAVKLGYVRRVDGVWLLSAELWPNEKEDAFWRRCHSPEIRAICDYSRCYRSREPQPYDDTDSPPYAEARRAAFASIATIELPSDLGVRLVEATPRAGKTRRLARVVIDAILAGERVVVFGPTHRALEELARYLAALTADLEIKTNVFKAVQVLGRGRNNEHCATHHRDRPVCYGCPLDTTMKLGDRVQPNRLLDVVRHGRATVADRQRIRDLAAGVACMHSASRKLAGAAGAVLATFSHLLQENWLEAVGGGHFDVMIIDEFDALWDMLAGEDNVITLMRSRKHAAAPIESECDRECDSCHMQFTSRPAINRWAGLTSLSNVADARGSEALLDPMFQALKALEADPAIAPCVEVARARANLEALAAALPTHDRVMRGHHVAPRAYNEHLIESAFGSRALERGSVGVHGIIVPMQRCVSDEAPSRHQARAWWRRNLLNPTASFEPEVEALLELLDYLDYAAMTANAVMLLPKSRSGTRRDPRKFCSIDLRIVHRGRAQRVVKEMLSHRTLGVTGTMPDEALLRSLFGDVEVLRLAAKLHRDLTVFVHSVGQGGYHDSFVPRQLEPEDVLALVTSLGKQMLSSAGFAGPFRARLYARSVSEHAKLLSAAVALVGDGVRIVDVAAPPVAVAAGEIEISVDYLRSSSSRAVDADVHLLVVYGSGYPNFEGVAGLAEVLSAAGAHVPVDLVAEDSRTRQVVQALLRSSALEGRRVALLINDMSVADLPSSIHHRVLPTEPLFREIDDSEDVPQAQRKLLIDAIAKALSPRAVLPARVEIEEWASTGRTAKPKSVRSNRKRFEAMLAHGRAGNVLRPSVLLYGGSAKWCSMLDWLEGRGVLRRLDGKVGAHYVFTDEALDFYR